MKSLNIEQVIVSGIFYGILDISKGNIKTEMFLNNVYKKYVEYVLSNLSLSIKEVNSKFNLKKKDKDIFFILEEPLVSRYFASFDINIVLELFYKNSIEQLVKRKMSTAGSENGEVLYELENIILSIQNLLKEIKNNNKEKESLSNSYKRHLLESRKASLESEIEGLAGMSTGFSSLDRITRGFKKEYIIVAGRPSMGKTALSLDFIVDSIFKGKNIFFCSVEMPKEHILARLIAKIDKSLSLGETMYADNYETSLPKIDRALEIIEQSNFEIEDFSDISGVKKMHHIESAAREYIKRHGSLDLAIVDYIQLLSPEDIRMSENQALTNISARFSGLVKETDATWMVLSQLSRDLEKRIDKRPMNSDLRGSGSLEQDADLIIFPYRDSIYLERDLKEKLTKSPDNAQLAEQLNNLRESEFEYADIIISKHRNGPLGDVKVEFCKKNASYLNPGEMDLDGLDDF